jgi:1,4-dihydroxy-2-naphthoate octaprenyltransferase
LSGLLPLIFITCLNITLSATCASSLFTVCSFRLVRFTLCCGSLDWHVLVVSAPLGFLIVNILHANNTRDIQHDRRAQITTQAMLLGLKGSKIQYLVLTIAAYVGIVLCVAFRILPWLSLVVLVTIPIAVRNVKCILAAQPGHPEMIRDLDGMTAQLVMTFGGTLAAMIAISLLF